MKCRRIDSARFELHDPSRQKSTRLTGSQVARHLEIREGEGMKCRRVGSTRLELHVSSQQKSTRVTGSKVARHLEIFCYVLERVRV